MSNPFKVKLVQQDNPKLIVVFDVTPDVSESRNIMYKTFDPVHAPGAIYMFQNTSSRTFQLAQVRLVSRSQVEAQTNIVTLQRLRAWCMPWFGRSGSLSGNAGQAPTDNSSSGGAASEANRGLKEAKSRLRGNRDAQKALSSDDQSRVNYGKGILGAPPNVLLLSAYSANQGESGGTVKTESIQHIRRIPVVITNLTINYPSDLDYIPTTSGVPMPTIMMLEIALTETQAPSSLESFSIEEYHQGILKGF